MATDDNLLTGPFPAPPLSDAELALIKQGRDDYAARIDALCESAADMRTREIALWLKIKAMEAKDNLTLLIIGDQVEPWHVMQWAADQITAGKYRDQGTDSPPRKDGGNE
jgi:hypothetical protein